MELVGRHSRETEVDINRRVTWRFVDIKPAHVTGLVIKWQVVIAVATVNLMREIAVFAKAWRDDAFCPKGDAVLIVVIDEMCRVAVLGGFQ